MSCFQRLVCVGAVLALGVAVQATPTTTALYDHAAAEGDPLVINLADYSEVTENPDGSINYLGSYLSPDGDWLTNWDVDVMSAEARGSSSLFIFATIGMTSLVDFDNDFQVMVTLPGTVPGPTAITGSVSGSVSDSSGDGTGATLTQNLAGDPFYTALIDGAVVRTLLDAPFTFTAPPNLTNPWDGGDFIDEGPHPAVTATITIDHRLRLSALDSVTFASTLLVTPEPASILLLAIGGLVLARRPRR